MTVEREVFGLIQTGASPIEVMGELGISRYKYDSAMSKLTDIGALGGWGQLPEGAEAEMCPSSFVSSWLTEVLSSADWPNTVGDPVKAICARYGIIRPQSTDPRYTFANWEGQAFRRVDFTATDGTDYMVVGALMPRTDKKRWKEGVPRNRVVYVESADVMSSLVWPRGRSISSERICAALSHHIIGPIGLRGLTLAIAWVCEARALFPERMVEE